MQHAAEDLLSPVGERESDLHYILALGEFGRDLQMEYIPGKGRGIVAKKAFKTGQTVFSEAPLFSQQHESSKDMTLACNYCMKTLGSLELQTAWLLRHGSLSEEIINRLQNGDFQLPFGNDVALPAPVACRGLCNELYCSQACADLDWEEQHSLLCPGEAAPHASTPGCSKALEEFYSHAVHTNDIFILAAKAIAWVLKRARNPGIEGVRQKQAALQEAWRPLKVVWKGLWWDEVAIPSDIDQDDWEAVGSFREDMKALASESLELLKAAILDPDYSSLFAINVYGSIIGMFELNNMGLSIPSALHVAFENSIEQSDTELTAESSETRSIIHALKTCLEEEEDIGCDGTGFFRVQSCVNHDCQPNVEGLQEDPLADNHINFIATRDIAIGEEITMSYIDTDLVFVERTEALKDYAFECNCKRCLLQQ